MAEPTATQDSERAARRLEQIMAVMKGERSVTQAAEALGVSRQTFYEWYNRALAALQDSLTDRQPGRPANPSPDPDKVRLEREKDELQHKVKLLQAAILIRDAMDGVPRVAAPPSDTDQVLATRSKKKHR
jgi:transposase